MTPVPLGDVAGDRTGATGLAGGVRDRVEELANAPNGRENPSIANTGPTIALLDTVNSFQYFIYLAIV